MEVSETRFPGLLIINPRRFGDIRGHFTQTYIWQTLLDAGANPDFQLETQTLSTEAGIIRGLHFQIPPAAQSKLVRCVRGSVYDVAVDLRVGSPTYLKWHGIELSPENGLQIFIPEGFAHGLLTLRPDSEVLTKFSHPYSRMEDRSIRWNDPTLNIEWPLNVEPILSEKDSLAPLLDSFSSPFILNFDIDNKKDSLFLGQSVTARNITNTLKNYPVEAHMVIISTISVIDENLSNIEASKPNDPLRLSRWQENKDHLINLKEMLLRLGDITSKSAERGPQSVSNDVVAETQSLLVMYRKKLMDWPRSHADEVTDGMMRISLVGICTAVGFVFGVPAIAAGIGATIFGGEKIAKAISGALKG